MALRAKNHFKDYDLEITLKNGKQVTDYVYKGDMYERDISADARNKERIGYLCLALLADIALLIAITRPVAVNIQGMFAAFSLLTIIPLFCVLEGAVEAFFRKGNIKKDNYQERLIMLRVMPLVGTGLGLVLCIGYIYYGLICKTDTAANLTACGCMLIAAAIYAAIAVHEIKVKYKIIKGQRSAGAPTGTGVDDNKEM